MPYKQAWVDPDSVVGHNDVWVFETYRNNDYNDARTYHFTLDELCGEEDCGCDADKCQMVFDVRDLPTWDRKTPPPTVEVNPQNREAWNEYWKSEPARIKEALVAAIDAGYLTEDGVKLPAKETETK